MRLTTGNSDKNPLLSPVWSQVPNQPFPFLPLSSYAIHRIFIDVSPCPANSVSCFPPAVAYRPSGPQQTAPGQGQVQIFSNWSDVRRGDSKWAGPRGGDVSTMATEKPPGKHLPPTTHTHRIQMTSMCVRYQENAGAELEAEQSPLPSPRPRSTPALQLN